MENGLIPTFRVSDFLAVVNQSLEVAFGMVEIEGEVASYKVSHQKYVFFDLKDEAGVVNCFMMDWQLRVPIQDGMRVVVRAIPKVTAKGKFSLTVQAVRLVGEGSLKKGFELLKTKLEMEGLFDEARKRLLPEIPSLVAVVSSVDAAGYADFMKIAHDRFGGCRFVVANVKVQGEGSADQIVRAIEYMNQQAEVPEVIVLVRGGGSAEDLAVFNDEALVRAIAASRVPVMTGIGHETDESLSDLVADVRAATPSNAAHILLPDKYVLLETVRQSVWRAAELVRGEIDQLRRDTYDCLRQSLASAMVQSERLATEIDGLERLLASLNPTVVMARGYALVRGKVEVGEMIEVETNRAIITAKVETYHEK